MTPDDLFRLQTIGTAAISPTGDAVAYVVQRPSSTANTFGRLYLWGNDRADVWVVSTTGKEHPRNITNGESDGSGFWAPQWSPDGRWLAMLSTRGGNIRLWVWQKDTGNVELLSDGGVDPRPGTFAWVSGNGIVFWTLPRTQQALPLAIDYQTPEITQREWTKDFAGQISTASVLESGTPIQSQADRRGECLLQVADPATKKTRILSRTPSYGEFAFATLQVSPDRSFVAFLKQTGVMQPTREIRTVEMLDAQYELTVVRLDGEGESATMTGVRRPFWGSLRWSPDNAELAVIGYDEALNSRQSLFRCRLENRQCRQVTNERFALRTKRKNTFTDLPYFWFGQHALAVRVASGTTKSDGGQEHWIITDEQGGLHDLLLQAADMNRLPDQALPDPCGLGLIVANERGIWRMNSDGSLQRKLADLTDAVAIGQPFSDDLGCSVLLSSSVSGKEPSRFLDLRTGTLESVGLPAPGASLLAIGRNRTLVFSVDDDSGSYLWVRSSGDRASKMLLTVNQFLGEIQPGELQHVEYPSLEGDALKGWTILPPDFKPGRRYPVVAWVYPGTVFGDTPPRSLVQINENHPLNLQLLAAHGYVVLLPSMPLPPEGLEADPYMELEKGVLPAIDKLVQMGIADPQRIAVMGQSFGGYGTYGLITQTNRFQAAVVLAGDSDLLSAYGTFDARRRYDSTGNKEFSLMWNVEGMGMGAPPWTDLERYIRNSPIAYVDRVQTPLLIMQGDLDFVPIQQGEEFFSALYRQNRRAEFVRYWGEDHILNSPANIRDMWQRIYAWLDFYLRPK
jgi:dipeptidyl aminopeptidase/acylaminoacyl peptidase